MKCEICGKEYAHLGLHLNYKHKDITQKEYYDRYLKKGGEGFCYSCGTPLSFINLIKGYKHYCNAKCELADPRINEKAKQTYKLRTGYDHNMHNPDSKARVKNTSEKKYGGIGFGVKELAEKSLNTFNNEHNTNIQSCNMIVHDIPELEEKRINTRIQNNNGKYISDNHREILNISSHTQEINEKRTNTRLENHGLYWSEIMKEKSKQTCKDKYGVEYWSSNHDNYNKILKNRLLKNNGFLSSVERKFAEMLKNRNIDFKYNYYYNNKHWDFAIFKDKKLDLIVEIDGEYNHGLIADADNKHIKGENDCKRFEQVGNNIKFLVIDSKKINDGIKETINLLGIDYNNFIENIIKSCNIPFPYPTYDDKRMHSDYERLIKYNNIKGSQTYSIITNFHKSIWKCHLKNKPSPFDAWNNPKLLRKCIENRFIYKSVLSTQNILHGFNICKIAPKISLFSPNIAKYLIKKYLNEYSEIFDPFCGYSGRMLGCCALNKKYIGNDINQITIGEANQIKDYLKLNADLNCIDIFKNVGTYNCLFTCPPYNDKENWNENIKNLSCDEWIDICLSHFNCKKYLFVVDKTEKYKDFVIEKIENNSHFNTNKEKIILIKQ